MSRNFYVTWNVPTYVEWLCKQDMTSVYQYYKKLLQLLLFRTQGMPLILKDPVHLPHLAILFKEFPDANFVWTHRDPDEVVSSYYSLSKTLKNEVALSEMKEGIKQLSLDLEIAIKARNTVNEAKFYDVRYQMLIKNPIKTVKEIYSYFDYNYSPEMEENIKEWLVKNPQHKYGIHRHDLTSLGITDDYISNQFSPYYDRFRDVIRYAAN